MPLRCIDSLMNHSIYGPDLAADEWRTLKSENKRTRYLRMPCCAGQVIPKKSHRGTHFFAHKRKGDCVTAPETEEHRSLKQMAVEAGRAYGWDAETEVTGTTPSGEKWRADVLAQKGTNKVAIEIQWSAQTNEETQRRQGRYAESGVQCVWLMRKKKFSRGDNSLPIVHIDTDQAENFVVSVLDSGGRALQNMSMHEFLEAVFRGRFLPKLSLGCMMKVSVKGSIMPCWRCGSDTKIITFVAATCGPYTKDLCIPDLSENSPVFREVRKNLPEGLGIGDIKPRYSKTQGRKYLSNGCVHCDALIGAFYEHDAWDDQKTVCEFSIRIDEHWYPELWEVFKDSPSDCWGVYSFGAEGQGRSSRAG